MPRNAPDWWRHKGVMSVLMMPAALATQAGGWIRLQRSGHKADVPVICVGNVVVGGAGKTPVVQALAELLTQKGKRVCILSKGYGGEVVEPTVVEPEVHTALQVGDEPLMLSRYFHVVVAKDRVKGAQLAVSQGAQVILMDDGFQDPALHQDISLLVVDSDYGFGNGRVMPAGPLREPVERAVRRAHAVVSTAPVAGVSLPHLPILLSPHPATLPVKKVLAFAGIARPEKFLRSLKEMQLESVDFKSFPDHYLFSESELADLKAQANAHGVALLCTEKDHVRLPKAWRDQVAWVGVKARFAEEEMVVKLLKQAGIF